MLWVYRVAGGATNAPARMIDISDADARAADDGWSNRALDVFRSSSSIWPHRDWG